MIDESEHKFLDRSEAGKFFGVHSDTIRNWQRQGKLPAPLILPNGKPVWTLEMLHSAIKKPAETAAA